MSVIPPMPIDRTSERTTDGPFRLSATQDGRTYRLALAGELDLGAVETVEAALAEAFDADVDVLEIDLSALTFLDSTGLRAILAARDGAAARALDLRLRRGPRKVQRVFALTGLEEGLPFVDEWS